MKAMLKKLAGHKGKAAAGSSLALVVYLLSRGCDVRIHVDPVKARTNDPASTLAIPAVTE